MEMHDVIIVGGGTAGLSAALVLGRCRRDVLVIDEGRPRNAPARHMHAFLTRDGIPPGEFLDIARDQLRAYPLVQRTSGRVVDVLLEPRFETVLGDGRRYRARKLLIATGVVDVLPPIPGLADLYGVDVHHCPYCDGWEARDKRLAVYGRGPAAAAFALELTLWSRDLVLVTDGPAALGRRHRDRMRRNRIPVQERPVASLEARDGRLRAIHFTNGEMLARDALFLTPNAKPGSDLARRLGCDLTEKGTVKTRRRAGTCVPGVFVAGDASVDIQLAVIAAAEGAQAAFSINTELLKEDLA